jgi:hypothetical protein
MTWSQQAILVDTMAGATGDDFGIAVAVSGDTIVVGADLKDVGAHSQQGQAYVFVRSGTTWAQQAILKEPMAGVASDQFASSLAIDGDTVVIGDYERTIGTKRKQGAASVFVRSGTAWSLQATLVDAVSGAEDDQLEV